MKTVSNFCLHEDRKRAKRGEKRRKEPKRGEKEKNFKLAYSTILMWILTKFTTGITNITFIFDQIHPWKRKESRIYQSLIEKRYLQHYNFTGSLMSGSNLNSKPIRI